MTFGVGDEQAVMVKSVIRNSGEVEAASPFDYYRYLQKPRCDNGRCL
jgi:hypothetical protein